MTVTAQQECFEVANEALKGRLSKDMHPVVRFAAMDTITGASFGGFTLDEVCRLSLSQMTRLHGHEFEVQEGIDIARGVITDLEKLGAEQ